jgi:hypothetical protein
MTFSGIPPYAAAISEKDEDAEPRISEHLLSPRKSRNELTPPLKVKRSIMLAATRMRPGNLACMVFRSVSSSDATKKRVVRGYAAIAVMKADVGEF